MIGIRFINEMIVCKGVRNCSNQYLTNISTTINVSECVLRRNVQKILSHVTETEDNQTDWMVFTFIAPIWQLAVILVLYQYICKTLEANRKQNKTKPKKKSDQKTLYMYGLQSHLIEMSYEKERKKNNKTLWHHTQNINWASLFINRNPQFKHSSLTKLLHWYVAFYANLRMYLSDSEMTRMFLITVKGFQ